MYWDKISMYSEKVKNDYDVIVSLYWSFILDKTF
jgi:hypothetical protein